MTRGAPRFAGSEADLCDWLIEREARHGWTAYPETGDWDVLMVRSDGVQVGIQAKLRPNLAVLEQASRAVARGHRPDVAACLVGRYDNAFEYLCRRLGLAHLWHSEDRRHGLRESQLVPWEHDVLSGRHKPPEKRVELPPFVPVMRAGVPCPTPLTRWKLAALRACMLYRRQGYLTTAEIRELGMDASRWLQMMAKDGKVGRHDRLVRGDQPLPDELHPELAAQVAAHYGAPAAAAIGGAA